MYLESIMFSAPVIPVKCVFALLKLPQLLEEPAIIDQIIRVVGLLDLHSPPLNCQLIDKGILPVDTHTKYFS